MSYMVIHEEPRAHVQFEAARRSVMPFAEARGYLTDEDLHLQCGITNRFGSVVAGEQPT
jgi:hypothetical protein